jgi:diaminopimelate epimerase
MRLAKAHAFGNDFLFVPTDDVGGEAELGPLTRRLCERHTGVGGDGVIYYSALPDGTARMRLVNADGSPSELSGNGLRCLAALVLHQRDGAGEPGTTLRVGTDAGWKTLTLTARAGARYTFRAAMGMPEQITQETLHVDGEDLPVVIMTMANPQCVALVEELPDPARFERLGPALATHPRFAAGTNVEFAVVETRNRVRILIWERGVGPTLASGTGACASAIAAAVAADAGRDLEVQAPGGSQRVEWQDDGVYLTGWAEVLFEGLWLAG